EQHVAPLVDRTDRERVRRRQGEQEHDQRRDEHHHERVRERGLQRERPGCRMGDVAVAAEAQSLVKRLRGCVLLGLEAREDGPGDREDPEEPDDPREHAQSGDDGTALADAEPCSAPPGPGHARSSSLKRLDRTRKANVAMMIEKTTTTIAYADAEP